MVMYMQQDFSFTSNKIKETHIKIIQKCYCGRMRKVSKDDSPNCPECKSKEGTFIYAFTKSMLDI